MNVYISPPRDAGTLLAARGVRVGLRALGLRVFWAARVEKMFCEGKGGYTRQRTIGPDCRFLDLGPKIRGQFRL